MTWDETSSGANVAGVLDLGLSNRTFAMHDLAVAIERSVIDWLDTTGRGHVSVDYGALDNLLAGYQEVTPLTSTYLAALCVVLPVAHVEFALSEVEYFGAIVDSPDNLDLAYQSYLLGHVQWFTSPSGVELLSHLVKSGSLSDGAGHRAG